MDGDDWDVEDEWLMAPVTPPRATMMVLSTYEVGVADLSGRVGEPHGYRDAIHAVDGGAPYGFGEEAPRTASGTPVVFLSFLPCWSRIFYTK
nr:hypothetical protein [Tanacetum cinerariifolium]